MKYPTKVMVPADPDDQELVRQVEEAIRRLREATDREVPKEDCEEETS